MKKALPFAEPASGCPESLKWTERRILAKNGAPS
jgi:hypothetical protein